MRSGLRRLLRRFALTLGGEVTQSAFHFGLNIALVRMLDAERYGVFAILMVMGAVSLTYVRALVGLPASLLVSQRRDTRAARAYETSFGSAALLVSGLAAAVVAALLHLWLRADALAGASFVGLWSLRGYLRTTLLARHRQVDAGLSDLATAASGTALALALLRPGDRTLDVALLVLCGANLAGIAVALLAGGQPVRVTFRSSMRRRFRALAGQLAWSAVGTTTANAQAQGLVLLIAGFAGPRAYAPIAAMLVLFAPIRLLSAALVNLIQPELASRFAAGRLPGFGRLMAMWIAAAGLFGGLYACAAIAAVPLMGSKIFEGQPWLWLGILVGGINAVFLASILPRVVLEILRRFRLIALASGASAALGMSAVAVLLATTSPDWTLLGNLGAEGLVLAWSWAAAARLVGAAPADGRGTALAAGAAE